MDFNELCHEKICLQVILKLSAQPGKLQVARSLKFWFLTEAVLYNLSFKQNSC